MDLSGLTGCLSQEKIRFVLNQWKVVRSVLAEDNSELRRRNSATSLCNASMSINEGTSALILVEGSGDDSRISLSFRCVTEQRFAVLLFGMLEMILRGEGYLVLFC